MRSSPRARGRRRTGGRRGVPAPDRRGVRPAAVAIGPAGRDVRYLLDGHHELAAYEAPDGPNEP